MQFVSLHLVACATNYAYACTRQCLLSKKFLSSPTFSSNYAIPNSLMFYFAISYILFKLFLETILYRCAFFNECYQSGADFEVENGTNPSFWEELSCGIYSLSMDTLKLDGYLVGNVKKHEWANTMLEELIVWERVSVKPKPEDLRVSHGRPLGRQHKMHSVSSDKISVESGYTCHNV